MAAIEIYSNISSLLIQKGYECSYCGIILENIRKSKVRFKMI